MLRLDLFCCTVRYADCPVLQHDEPLVVYPPPRRMALAHAPASRRPLSTSMSSTSSAAGSSAQLSIVRTPCGKGSKASGETATSSRADRRRARWKGGGEGGL